MAGSVQIHISVDAEADPVVVGDALAQLIKAVPTGGVVVEASQDVLVQISSQLRNMGCDRPMKQINPGDNEQSGVELNPLLMTWDNPPDEQQLNN